MKSSEKTYFNKISDSFDTGFNVYGKPAGNLRVLRRVELFAKYCSLKKGSKILEIGCGTGEYSKALLKDDFSLLATDLSINMLAKARIKLNAAKNITFFASDAGYLPISDSSCDVVLGNSVLHHLETESALKEIYRVMKKGGRFAFSEPNILNPYIFLQKNIKFIKKLTGDSPDERAFSRRNLKKMFEGAGFKSVFIKPFDFLFPHTPSSFVNLVNKLGLLLEKTLLKEIAGSLFVTGEK
ncbi:MAG: methyltransferase domain-containing protein [Candidatus Omnitrophica bacterium]|nr:methyltransferase domain-containing protein [Candidatus Omnitrophota bacterium]